MCWWMITETDGGRDGRPEISVIVSDLGAFLQVGTGERTRLTKQQVSRPGDCSGTDAITCRGKKEMAKSKRGRNKKADVRIELMGGGWWWCMRGNKSDAVSQKIDCCGCI